MAVYIRPEWRDREQMIQIRNGVFETNSSSTHAICIAKDSAAHLPFPKSVHFTLREFGWEQRELRTVEEKAAYLYAALIETSTKKELAEKTAWLVDTLFDVGVETEFDQPVYGQTIWGERSYSASIDHVECLDEFLKDIMGNRRRLLRFLFSPRSFVVTGNDNSYERVQIHVDYPYEEYYKGN